MNSKRKNCVGGLKLFLAMALSLAVVFSSLALPQGSFGSSVSAVCVCVGGGVQLSP